MFPPARRIASRLLSVAALLLVAACGPSQQGGFQGFPPSEVTTMVVEPKTVPATYEYVGQTAGSKEVEVRARVTGILESKLYQEGAPVKSGQVRINSYSVEGSIGLPFGGYKRSGFGREQGVEALANYTQLKNVMINFS